MAKSIVADIRDSIKSADALYRLIYANIGVYLLLLISNSFSKLFTGTNDDIILSYAGKWLAVPSNLNVLITRPWTLITYMFLHFEFLHILFNLLWLYWMGIILRDFLGSKKVFSTYIIGGLCGAVLYITVFNISPFFSNALNSSYALGASAGVLAITAAAATLVPNYSVRLILIGAVPLKYIAIATIALDFVSISGSNAGGHIAHIGGAIYGFVYIRQLQQGNDMAGWFNRLMDKLTNKSSGSGMKVKYRRTVSDEEYAAGKKSRQERMDEILDKISKSGYGSLTQEEKDILFKSSKDA